MKTFAIYHESGSPAGVLADPDSAIFVKEGPAWAALLVPFLWALWNRLWLVSLAILALAIALGSAAQAFNLPSGVTFSLSALVNLLIALEGNELRRWTLERRGFVQTGVVTGPSLYECEQIYFDRLIRETGTRASRPAPEIPALRLRAESPDDGLFPAPGGPQ